MFLTVETVCYASGVRLGWPSQYPPWWGGISEAFLIKTTSQPAPCVIDVLTSPGVMDVLPSSAPKGTHGAVQAGHTKCSLNWTLWICALFITEENTDSPEVFLQRGVFIKVTHESSLDIEVELENFMGKMAVPSSPLHLSVFEHRHQLFQWAFLTFPPVF